MSTQHIFFTIADSALLFDLQIYHEARKFAKAYGLQVLCVYGGGSRWEQSNAVKEGCDILVATPGRLIDLVKLKSMSLERVTYLVFDEADRMFDMGFGGC